MLPTGQGDQQSQKGQHAPNSLASRVARLKIYPQSQASSSLLLPPQLQLPIESLPPQEEGKQNFRAQLKRKRVPESFQEQEYERKRTRENTDTQQPLP